MKVTKAQRRVLELLGREGEPAIHYVSSLGWAVVNGPDKVSRINGAVFDALYDMGCLSEGDRGGWCINAAGRKALEEAQ